MRQTMTGRRDGHRGGARALAGMVRNVCAANVALAIGGCVIALRWGALVPCAVFALLCVLSAAMVSGLRNGGAE